MSKIEHAEVFVASPGRTFVTLRITTTDGVTASATPPSTDGSWPSPRICATMSPPC